MVGAAMLSPVPPGYTLALALNKDATSPVPVTVCAQKPDGSAATTPDGDHVLAVMVDGVQVATRSTSAFVVTVARGTHNLRAELLTRDHREFSPALAADTVIAVTGTSPCVVDAVCGSVRRGRDEPTHTIRRSTAQRVSSWRLDSCSLRSTDETCVSTVFTDRCRRSATSL